MAASASPSTAEAADSCAEPKTTLEQINCRSEQLDAEAKKQKKYFEAANKQAALFGLNVKKLDQEQLAWENYRQTLCGNVYLLWAQGTVRYEKSADCNLRLIQDRTYDLWRSYLTYLDSTPPVLPDPRQ